MAASTGTYRLGPDAGRVVIKTTRAGLAARVGHDLTLDVTRWSADITVPAGEMTCRRPRSAPSSISARSPSVREAAAPAR